MQRKSLFRSESNRRGSFITTQRFKLDSIQVLRGIAALLVVFLHSNAYLTEHQPSSSYPQSLAHWGHSGVDIFFVLSGLLMVLTTSGRTPGVIAGAAFFRARLVRILPLYWLLTSSVVAALLLAPSVFNKQQFDPWTTLASFLFVPVVDAAGMPAQVLYVGWTLTYEMLFYAIFACLLLRFTSMRIVPVAAIILMTLAVAGPLLGDSLAARTLSNTLMLEFVFGTVIAWAYLRAWKPPTAACWGLVAAGLAAAVAFELAGGLPRFVHYGVPAGLIVAGCLFAERASAWPRLQVLKAIGNSSYSLYLTHILVIPITGRLLEKSGLQASLPGDLIILLLMVICAIVGHAIFLLIERPMDERLRTRVAGDGQLPAGAVTSSCSRPSPG